MNTMLKYLVNSIAILSLFALGASNLNAYDQSFPIVKLRQGYQYNFSDTYNAGANAIGVNKVSTTFQEITGDFNVGANPEFPWTPAMISAGYVVPANTSIKMVESAPKYYQVTHRPAKRATGSQVDLSIVYDATIYINDGGTWVGPQSHTEYQPYIITWCGDGVKDNYTDPSGAQINEQCDGTQGINPATQTCSTSCQIINNPVPVCNSISPSNVVGGILSTNNTFTTAPISCDVSNSGGHDVKVNCGNGTTVNSGQSCTYNTGGTFSAYCMIDGENAGTQCSTNTFTVTTRNPSYTIAKVDFNSSDNDGDVGGLPKNDRACSATVKGDCQTLNVGATAVFQIHVKNTGNVALTNVRVTDPLTPSCDRTIGTLAAGASYPAYTCTKPNAQRGTFPAGVNTAILSSNELPNQSNSSKVLFENPTCTNLSVDNGNSNIAPSDSGFTCTGENNDNFTVKYFLNGNVIKTFSTNEYQGSAFSGNMAGLGEGDYAVTCTVDNQPLQDKCFEEFTIVKPKTPSIAIEKTAIDGTEFQTILSGGQAGFKIKVTNDGETNLTGPFTLTDPKVTSGNCSGLVTLPGTRPSSFGSFEVNGSGNNGDSILQIGESFEYICYEDDVVLTTFNGQNVITVDAPTVDPVSDPTYITIITPVCNNVTVENTTRIVPFQSGKIVCSGNSTNFNDYTITISKDGSVVKTVNSKETTFNFTEVANYEVKCSVNGATSNACTLPIITNSGTTPDISLIKTDFNAGNDYDSREDNQKVIKGTEAVFKITVKNEGEEDLKDLTLTDTTNTAVNGKTDYTSVCGGSVDLTAKKLASGQDLEYTGTGPNLKVGESFSYVCTIENTTNGYTNTAEVSANSVVDGEQVDATNPSYVTTGEYDLALVKKVSTETSVFQKGGTVEYEITVENQGDIDAEGITVTDYIPTGMKLKDSNWDLTGDKATRNIGNVEAGDSKIVKITLEIEAESGTIINWAEISSTTDGNVDCDSTPDDNQANDDYTTDFANGTNSSVNPDGCNENDGDEDDHDPATIVVSKYDLALIKTVVDLQDEYLSGSTVTFKIDVINQGTIDANDVVVTDYFPTTLELIDTTWTDNGTMATKLVGSVPVGDPKSVTITFKVLPTASGNIINTAEISSGDGIDCDSTADNENNNTDGEKIENIIDDAVGTACEPGGDEDDHDIAVITTPVSDTGKIKIEKYSNQGQADQDDDKTRLSTDDNQLINKGETAKFNIRVTNEGPVDLINVIVTDALTGTTCNKTIDLLPTGGTPVEYTCIRENATEDYTNSVSVVATNKTTNLPITPDDNDTDTTDVKVKGSSDPIGKIKIEKYSNQGATDQDTNKDKDAADDNQLINKGETAKFNIRVTNEGPVDLINVIVTDALTGTTCNKTIDLLPTGGTPVEYTCIRENATEDYTNSVSVVATNKTTNLPITPDDNDTDTTDVKVKGSSDPIGKIKIEKYSNQGATDQDTNKDKDAADDNQLINKGETAKFNIRVTNEGTVDLTEVVITDALTGTTCDKTIAELPAGGEPVIYTCERANAQSDYTNTVSVVAKNKTTGLAITPDGNDSDTTSVDVPSGGGGGGGGGGGSSPACYNIEQSGNEYTCTVNKKTWKDGSAGIDCDGDGKYEQTANKNSGITKVNGRYEVSFTCTAGVDAGGNPIQLTPKCGVHSNSNVNVNQSFGWTTSSQCKMTGTTPYCGDGKVQPNGVDNISGNSDDEQCDGGSSNGTSDSSCTSTCKNKSRVAPPTCGDKTFAENNEDLCGLKTYPTGGAVKITTVSNFVIGGQEVFEYGVDKYSFNSDQFAGEYLKIENVGTEAINLQDKLCVMDEGSLIDSNNKSIISGPDLRCNGNLIGWIYPNESRYYRTENLSTMKGDPDNLTAGYTSETNKLVLTIQDSNGDTYEWSPILAGEMFVTVAKPTIANRGGGLAYISDSGDNSNVNDIATTVNSYGQGVNVNTAQANFVATVLGSGSNLSEVETVTDTVVVAEVEKEAVEVTNTSTVIDTTSMVASTNFASYNGLSNVFAKKGSYTMSAVPTIGSDISKTFIIENGDLTITSDIISNKNVAFIVKNGDIIIEPGVENITGTYISIGGEVKSGNSDKKLTVNGSLYGDLTNLTANRTHISMDTDGNINVGTIISYGSNLLNKPAPLVGQFINESIQAQKLAQ